MVLLRLHECSSCLVSMVLHQSGIDVLRYDYANVGVVGHGSVEHSSNFLHETCRSILVFARPNNMHGNDDHMFRGEAYPISPSFSWLFLH